MCDGRETWSWCTCKDEDVSCLILLAIDEKCGLLQMNHSVDLFGHLRDLLDHSGPCGFHSGSCGPYRGHLSGFSWPYGLYRTLWTSSRTWRISPRTLWTLSRTSFGTLWTCRRNLSISSGAEWTCARKRGYRCRANQDKDMIDIYGLCVLDCIIRCVLLIFDNICSVYN